jgi:hypothetical protein
MQIWPNGVECKLTPLPEGKKGLPQGKGGGGDKS